MQYPKIFQKAPSPTSGASSFEPNAQEIERAQLRSSFVGGPTHYESNVAGAQGQQPDHHGAPSGPGSAADSVPFGDDHVNEEAIREREYLRSLRAARKTSTNMVIGHLYEGKVTGVHDYGVFVTFPNRECGLVFINEVVWQGEIEDGDPLPYAKGDIVTVEVISFSPGRGLSLSLKRPRRGEVFEKFANNYDPGSTINGVVTSVKDYGAFVRVAPGVDGLLHIALVNNLEVIKNLAIGSTIPVIVHSFDFETKRVSLKEPLFREVAP
jgi:predicted RNA-binding protein with RPS1 domain